jgi:hypothetical protein
LLYPAFRDTLLVSTEYAEGRHLDVLVTVPVTSLREHEAVELVSVAFEPGLAFSVELMVVPGSNSLL